MSTTRRGGGQSFYLHKLRRGYSAEPHPCDISRPDVAADLPAHPGGRGGECPVLRLP